MKKCNTELHLSNHQKQVLQELNNDEKNINCPLSIKLNNMMNKFGNQNTQNNKENECQKEINKLDNFFDMIGDITPVPHSNTTINNNQQIENEKQQINSNIHHNFNNIDELEGIKNSISCQQQQLISQKLNKIPHRQLQNIINFNNINNSSNINNNSSIKQHDETSFINNYNNQHIYKDKKDIFQECNNDSNIKQQQCLSQQNSDIENLQIYKHKFEEQNDFFLNQQKLIKQQVEHLEHQVHSEKQNQFKANQIIEKLEENVKKQTQANKFLNSEIKNYKKNQKSLEEQIKHLKQEIKMLNIDKEIFMKTSSKQSTLIRTYKLEEVCLICMDERRTHISLPCGHFIYCEKCLDEVIKRDKKDPMCSYCRVPIKSSVRVIVTNIIE